MKHKLALFALTTALVLGQSHAVERPNVILILSDDQGFTDYGFMGHQVIQTPNLDRMAAQSLLYTRGYVMPVCSPSLACLLTGRLPHQHGITGNDLTKAAQSLARKAGQEGRSPLAKQLLGNPLILPQALSDAGYLTFQTGKLWNVTAEEVGFTSGMTNSEGRHGGDGLDIGRNSMKPIYEFIEKAQREEKPFFVWYAPFMPHQPHDPPKEFLARYQNKGLSAKAEKYYGMIEWFDKTCGELDDYLTRNHLAENTLIVYLADNGWDAEEGNRAKLSPYEMGIRTPIFVRWAGKVAPRRDDETLASIVDFVPTVLGACGVKVPSDLPGLNLLDQPAMAARKSVFVEAYTHNIAELGNPAKSLVAQVVINGWHKLVIPGPVPPDRQYTSAPKAVELFDLKSDPLETHNLASEQAAEVSRLRAIQNAEWSY